MTRGRAIGAGFLAGFIAGLLMTVTMLFLAWLFGVATPLVIFGDRLSVFIPADTFLSLIGRVGGYNNMKQLGVGSVIAGQLLVGGLGGIIYGLVMRRHGRNRFAISGAIFILLPLLVVGIFLWPVLGTNYHGLPINRAIAVTLSGLLVAFVVFERTIVLLFRFLSRARVEINDQEFSPSIGRRALIASGIAILVAGGGAELVRRLYRIATFSYDGTQYKGRIVQPITPNDLFYCVTKNVIDPRVNVDLWHLEVNGLVQNPTTYRFQDLKAFNQVEQETTLMCISNGLDAGLISNAVWKGITLRDLIDPAGPMADARRVRLFGVDNYTDTIPLEKALDPTTILASAMNGVDLPHRHGYPLRAIVPGYFGEKHVKWLTRIELTGEDVKGFYETQGWGPDFMTPTRSRIDAPDHESRFSLGQLSGPIEVKGIAFGGDRGVSRVEISDDDGETWTDASIHYAGTKLTWALWTYEWRPDGSDDYTLVVRATDGEGALQEWEEDRSPFSGVTGFHKIAVHVTA